MSILGMPWGMFLVFAATILAGSLGAIHYITVHVVMGKPVAETIREESQEIDEELTADGSDTV